MKCKPIAVCGISRSGTTMMLQKVGSHPQVWPSRWECLVLEGVRGALNIARMMQTGVQPSLRPADIQMFRNNLNRHLEPNVAPGINYKAVTENFIRRVTCKGFKQHNGTVTVGVMPLNNETRRNAVYRLLQEAYDEPASKAGMTAWVIKRPKISCFLPELLDIVPEMNVIHCIRDPRDVLCSIMAQSWGAATFADALQWYDLWLSRWEVVRPQVADHPGYIESCYEDFVTSDRTWKKILHALGLDQVNLQTVHKQEVYSKAVGKHKRNWTPHQTAQFEKRLGKRVRKLGFIKD